MANFGQSPLQVPIGHRTFIPPGDEDRTTGLLSPAPSFPALPHRHSAPTVRSRWLRRASSSNSGKTLVSAEDTRGPVGLNLLFAPSEPRVDLIFVHGLQGGSRKTWSHIPEDPLSYWPKEWLPFESGFKHVRIHSFGYDSDWRKRQESALTLHDFAQGLLADMHNSPHLKRNGSTRIVFVAHSMGGLLVKKAYLLSTRDPLYESIASRVHSFYFLGTPHRGANSTVFLKAFLSMSLHSGQKAYIKELLPDSQTVHDINDEFRHVCRDVQLWSFFEGEPTAGVMIVEKSSAIIGLPGEHTRYLQADHRHVCKFENAMDPNYNIILRCLTTTVEEIEKDYATGQRDNYKAEIKLISNALDIAHRPERDLLTELDKLHRGSCQWLTKSEDFQNWLSCEVGNDVLEFDPLDTIQTNKAPRFLWLNGPPGSGKSVASGHVIDYLHSNNFDSSYFFFKNNAKATVTQLLLSLAFQMAESNFEVRQAFVAMIKETDVVNIQDHTVIWNNIFLGRIFKIQFSQPQFWVIDALDECPNKSLTTLIQMFAKIDSAVPLRVFTTSRSNTHIERLFNQEKIDRIELHTGQEDSMNDISAYIRSQPKLQDGDDASEIISEILKKSNGIFLWASRIVNDLDELYSIEDMRAALRQVPSEMNGLYTRMLEDITNSSSADLAKCILTWVVCAPEPLTTEELREAVRLDISRTLVASASDNEFSQICKHLITVDSESHVQLMHATVREFLISGEYNFYINPREAHERLATICLTYLNGRNFSTRSHRRTTSTTSPGRPGGDFAFDRYASFNFSYHLVYSRSIAAPLFSKLKTFVNSNILTWTERIAKTGKLGPFIQAIQNLKSYLARQLDRSPPFDREYQNVNAWVNDLTRVVAIFGPSLIDSPSTIYQLIPALCPTSSVIHQTFAAKARHKVLCSSNTDWDERLSCLLFPFAAKSVASSDQYLAVGLANGSIRVYNSSTLEVISTLDHGAPVRQLAFGNISNILASCSPKKLTLWGPQRTKLWSVSTSRVAFSVCFNADDSKVFVTVKGDVGQVIMGFLARDGTQLETLPITGDRSDSDSDDNHGSHERYIPDLVRLSPVLGFAAVAYRSSHLTLFSLDSEDNLEKICRFEKEGCEALALPPQVLDVTFNPAVESDLMAVSYQDGDIVTVEIDGWNAHQKNCYALHAGVLASSPDGRTLAAGDNEGGVSLFAFDTLRLMHRIAVLDDIVTGIIFASNSLRFYDIRARACNIWEPPVLVRRQSVDDNSTEPEESDISAPDMVINKYDDNKAITAMTQAGDDNFIFCGREDGSMTVYDLNNGKKVLEIQLHSVDISHLEWHSRVKVLFSVDTSGRCVATRLSAPVTGAWAKLNQVFSRRANAVIIQALMRPDGLAVLLSSHDGEVLWEDNERSESEHSLGIARWMHHPTNESRLLLIDGNKIHLYLWAGLKRETRESGVSLVLTPEMAEMPLQNDWSYHLGINILVQAIQTQTQSRTGFLALDVSHIQALSNEVHVSATIRKLPAGVKAVLGIHRSSIFFLTRRGWICSLSLKPISDAKFYTRHFFIPPFWQTGGESMIRIVSKSSVAFAYRDDLVIFHRFLDIDEKVTFDVI